MDFSHHHAFVIEGKRDIVLPLIKQALEANLSLSFEKNPDIFQFDFDTFLVDHAHTIKEADLKANYFLPHKFIVISFSAITREAQNALLKVLEDPTGHTKFIIVTHSKEILLPTIISRVAVIRHASFHETASPVSVEVFLKAPPAKRLEMVGKLLKEVAEETKTKRDVSEFVFELKIHLEQHIKTKQINEKKLLSTLKALQYITDPSASQKLILERLCVL